MSKLSGQRAETKVGAGTAGIQEEGLNWRPGKRRGKGGREKLPRNFPQGLADSPAAGPAAHSWDHQKPWVLPSYVLCAQVPLKRSLFLVTAGSKQPSLPRQGAVLSKGCTVHQASPLNLPPHSSAGAFTWVPVRTGSGRSGKLPEVSLQTREEGGL